MHTVDTARATGHRERSSPRKIRPRPPQQAIDSTIHRDCHKMYPRTFSGINLVSSPTQIDMSHDGVQDEPQLLKRIGIECEHASMYHTHAAGVKLIPAQQERTRNPHLLVGDLNRCWKFFSLDVKSDGDSGIKTVTVSSKAVRIAMVVLSASTCPALTPSASSHLVCEDVNLHMQTLIYGRKNVRKYQTRVFSKTT